MLSWIKDFTMTCHRATYYSGHVSIHTRDRIIIVNSKFLQRPQKRSRGNQLIHRRCPKQNRLAAGQIQGVRQAGRQSDGYGRRCSELRRGGRQGEEDESGQDLLKGSVLHSCVFYLGRYCHKQLCALDLLLLQHACMQFLFSIRFTIVYQNNIFYFKISHQQIITMVVFSLKATLFRIIGLRQ